MHSTEGCSTFRRAGDLLSSTGTDLRSKGLPSRDRHSTAIPASKDLTVPEAPKALAALATAGTRLRFPAWKTGRCYGTEITCAS